MPVKNICPSKCQFSMPQITKARSLSALAAVVLLAGVSYAVSKPVYNFACQHEIMWLKTPFDRIASIRDKVLVKCSLKVDAETLFNNYRNRIGKNEKIWTNLMIAVGKNDSSEIQSLIPRFLHQELIECRSLFCVAEQVQIDLSEEKLFYNIHKELMHASTATEYFVNLINRDISPDLLLQLYKLEKNSMIEGNPEEIEDHMKKKLREGDSRYLAAVMKFLVNNPEFGEAFGDKGSNLESFKTDWNDFFSSRLFDHFSAEDKIEFLLEYLEVLTSIDNEKDLVNKYTEKLAKIVADDYSAAASQNLDDDIALRLEQLVIKNPEVELHAHESYKMLDYRLQIAIGELSIRNIDELCGISEEEKVICLFKLADRAHNSSDIKAAFLKAKEISNDCSDDNIKIKALSRLLEAQIKHKISGAKATFKEIEEMLDYVWEGELDQETWGRIALADFELNYKAWSFNSLKFWA